MSDKKVVEKELAVSKCIFCGCGTQRTAEVFACDECMEHNIVCEKHDRRQVASHVMPQRPAISFKALAVILAVVSAIVWAAHKAGYV